MKVLKYALALLAALVALSAAVIAYLVVTFDARDHAPRIVELVKQKTGRTLQIDGAIELSFWPDLAVNLGAASLSERGSDAPFANIGNARLSVRLLPLLSRALVADEILIEDAHVRITRFADGRFNIDDLLGGDEGPLEIRIGRVRLARAAVTYRDLEDGSEYALSAIDLETGRISDGQSMPVRLSLRARDVPQTFDLSAALEGRYTLGTERQGHALEEAAIELRGQAPGLSDLVAGAQGSFALDMTQRRLDARGVSLALNAGVHGSAIEASFDSPVFTLSAERSGADSVVVRVRSTGQGSGVGGSLELPRIDYEAGTISAGAAAGAFELDRAGRRVRATLESALAFDVAARMLRLTDLSTRFEATGAGLPRSGIHGALAGAASADFAAQAVKTALTGRIGVSQVKAVLGSRGFASPRYTFAVTVDSLDLDRYAADSKRGSTAGGFDLGELAALPATGTIRIGTLTREGLRARDVQLAVRP